MSCVLFPDLPRIEDSRSWVCCTRCRGPRTHSRTTDSTLDCALIERTCFCLRNGGGLLDPSYWVYLDRYCCPIFFIFHLSPPLRARLYAAYYSLGSTGFEHHDSNEVDHKTKSPLLPKLTKAFDFFRPQSKFLSRNSISWGTKK